MTERITIIPDTQIPFNDRAATSAVIRYIGDTQPDKVIHIGDLMDYPGPSRWSKGSAEEFLPKLRAHNKRGIEFLEELRSVYDGPVEVHEGNHDLRPRTYLSKYAPALGELEDSFHIENMLDFDGFGVTLLPDFNEIAPGWVSTHGHLGKISLSPIAGNTALGGAKKFQQSVVMGHTHRLGVLSHSFGYAGKVVRAVTGFEVGHLMQQRKASYLQNGTGNWQMGFGQLTVDGKYVQAQPIPINHGRFVVGGETWEV